MPWPQGDRADRQRISNIEQKQEILPNRTSEDIWYTVGHQITLHIF